VRTGRGIKKNKKPSPLLIKADGIGLSAFAKYGFITLVISAQTVLISYFEFFTLLIKISVKDHLFVGITFCFRFKHPGKHHFRFGLMHYLFQFSSEFQGFRSLDFSNLIRILYFLII
jgi:hypothetical protein